MDNMNFADKLNTLETEVKAIAPGTSDNTEVLAAIKALSDKIDAISIPTAPVA